MIITHISASTVNNILYPMSKVRMTSMEEADYGYLCGSGDSWPYRSGSLNSNVATTSSTRTSAILIWEEQLRYMRRCCDGKLPRCVKMMMTMLTMMMIHGSDLASRGVRAGRRWS